VVIDTETTGLGATAEICQLSAVDLWGNILFNELIKPRNPISPEASAIHHITDDMVKNCNGIRYYWDYFTKQYIHQKLVVGYNVMFDFRMLIQSINIADPEYANTRWMTPVMIIDLLQTIVLKNNPERWPKLSGLAASLGVELPDEKMFHNSVYDCKVTAACFRETILL
jgi:DNA polymerase-3 subunit epsilon